jgi:hypothetical protein
MSNKIELIEEILKEQGSERNVLRSAKQMRPMIAMMVQMSGGKSEDIDPLSRKLAESLIPIIKDAAREQYANLFTDDQLEALAEFHRANPWFADKSCELNEALSATATEKAGPMMKEIFDEYLPDEEEQ